MSNLTPLLGKIVFIQIHNNSLFIKFFGILSKDQKASDFFNKSMFRVSDNNANANCFFSNDDILKIEKSNEEIIINLRVNDLKTNIN